MVVLRGVAGGSGSVFFAALDRAAADVVLGDDQAPVPL
jgi:hypothetical protein